MDRRAFLKFAAAATAVAAASAFSAYEVLNFERAHTGTSSTGTLKLTGSGPDFETFVAPNIDRIEKLREYLMSPWDQSTNKVGYNPALGLIEGDHFCLPRGELVLTDVGLLPIEQIRVGQNVYTHRGRFRKVLRTFEREYDGEVVEIGAGTVDPLKVTSNHPLLVSVGSYVYPKGKKTRVLGSIRWIPAGEITMTSEASSFLVTPIPKEMEDVSEISIPFKFNQFKIPKSFPVNADLMTLIGYYLAEGSEGCQGRRSNGNWKIGHAQFQFGKGLMEFQNAFEVSQAARNLGLKSTIYVSQYGAFVVVYSTQLMKFLKENFGNSALNKHLPRWVLKLPPSKLGHLLRAYTNGSGHLEREVSSPVYSICSISRNLLEQMRLICLKLGYLTYLHRSQLGGESKILGRRVYTHDKYELRFTEKSHRGKAPPWDTDFQYLRINSINKTKYRGRVYNIEVEEDNSYLCPAGVVHNCGGFNDGCTLFDPNLTIGTTLDYLNEQAVASSVEGAIKTNISGTARSYLGESFYPNSTQIQCDASVQYPYRYNNEDRREVLFGNKVDAIHPSVGYAFIKGHDLTSTPAIDMEVVGSTSNNPNSMPLNELPLWICLQYLNGNGQSEQTQGAISSIINDWNGSVFQTYDPQGSCRDYGFVLHMLRATGAWMQSSKATAVAKQVDSQIWSLQNSDGGMRFSSSSASTGGEEAGMTLVSHDPRLPSWFPA